MAFETIIKGKKYKVNISAERWASLQKRSKSRQTPTPEQIVPEKEEERGWLTSPISPKISKWVQEKTEPEEDDWYSTRVGKRIGRVLGEDINSPLGAGITGLAALAGPFGWAAKAGKLGMGLRTAANSSKAVTAGKAAQVGFGALGVSQTPELVRSGGEFLETKSPESLGDTLISGTEVAGGGYLLGSAARRARRAKKPAEEIIENTFSTKAKIVPEKPLSTLPPEKVSTDKLMREQSFLKDLIRIASKDAKSGKPNAKEKLARYQNELGELNAELRPAPKSEVIPKKTIEAPLPEQILSEKPKPFQARTVAESDAAITRPVERARDWISKGSSTLVDKVQPLKASSKADEKLLRQTLEVMVERQIQKTGKTPTENSVKRLRSQIITKIGTEPNKKFAELGKIFSSQKKQLASLCVRQEIPLYAFQI